jgi:hypothetical protein
MEFEEVWRRLPPIIGAKHAWILQGVDGKTFLGKNGGGYMALYEGVKGFGVTISCVFTSLTACVCLSCVFVA